MKVGQALGTLAELLPEGFAYRPGFLSVDEERDALERIRHLEFSEVRMHGVTAKRRVIHYGLVYAYESFKLTPGPPLPDFLLPIRDRAAEAAGVGPGEIAEALLTQYQPGAAIGWHRDAPSFDIVIAVSLAGACRLRFRKGTETAEIRVEPRSLYILSGKARNEWQHHIPPTKELRYSLTFRTVRKRRPRDQS